MFRWLGNFVDNNEKEVARLRGIVDRVNTSLVDLLNEELDDLRAVRADLAGLLKAPGVQERLGGLFETAIREAGAENTRLAGLGAENRRVIEEGETTTRQLNVLMADSRQLEQLQRDLTARRGDRAELETNIGDLSERIQAQIADLATLNVALEDVAGSHCSPPRR